VGEHGDGRCRDVVGEVFDRAWGPLSPAQRANKLHCSAKDAWNFEKTRNPVEVELSRLGQSSSTEWAMQHRKDLNRT
jgi:hypothetical protein